VLAAAQRAATAAREGTTDELKSVFLHTSVNISGHIFEGTQFDNMCAPVHDRVTSCERRTAARQRRFVITAVPRQFVVTVVPLACPDEQLCNTGTSEP
jgi:hypothetical protein